MQEEDDMQDTSATPWRSRRGWYALAAALVVALVGVGAVASARSNGPVDSVAGTAPSPGSAEGGPPSEESPHVAELRSVYRTVATCLERQGFTVAGPIPRSSGLGMAYVATSPPGGPELVEPNPCERSLDEPAMNFVNSSVEDQRQLVVEFNRLMRCLAVDHQPLPTTGADGTARDTNGDGKVDRTDSAFVEDAAAEKAVLDVLQRAPEMERRCLG